MSQITKKVRTLFLFFTWLTAKGSIIALSVLDTDIELAEHKFLEETLIDDEENDDGITNDDDHEFDTTWASLRDQVLVVPLATKMMWFLSEWLWVHKMFWCSLFRRFECWDCYWLSFDYHWARQLRIESGYCGSTACWNEWRMVSCLPTWGALLDPAFVNVLTFNMHSRESLFARKCSFSFTG